MMAGTAPRPELAVRTASAIVMIAVAGTALWMGGTVFTFFVALVAFLVVLEFRGLVVRFPDSTLAKGIWMAVGGVYAALGCASVLLLHDLFLFVPLLAAVIGTDVGAYFAGRAIGGPKIAPAISPSKTWAGLGGGIVGSVALFTLGLKGSVPGVDLAAGWPLIALMGALIAIFAQAGDFFESWLKRRAGGKDSGTLIPGHGGMFDRGDGLLAASIFLFVCARAFLG